MQFDPSSRYFASFESKYSQHPVLKRLQYGGDTYLRNVGNYLQRLLHGVRTQKTATNTFNLFSNIN
jgi:hypothetical protein